MKAGQRLRQSRRLSCRGVHRQRTEQAADHEPGRDRADEVVLECCADGEAVSATPTRSQQRRSRRSCRVTTGHAPRGSSRSCSAPPWSLPLPEAGGGAARALPGGAQCGHRQPGGRRWVSKPRRGRTRQPVRQQQKAWPASATGPRSITISDAGCGRRPVGRGRRCCPRSGFASHQPPYGGGERSQRQN
jgi:hypothetical protein